MSDQASKCVTFAELHRRSETWLIPNPWDVGSAKILQGLGYPALATTSSGFAFTLGRADGQVSLEEKLQHCKLLAQATTIPVNADFENGFADDLVQMQDNIKRMVATGVTGLSVEDYSRDRHVIYELNEAIDRVSAAREAIDATGIPVLLTARAENLIRGVDDREQTLQRLRAYSEAGADVLYAPGLREMAHVQEFVDGTDKPLNVLAPLVKNASMEQFNGAGVCRISVGGALTWATVHRLLAAGKEMLDAGSFDWLTQLANSTEVQSLFES